MGKGKPGRGWTVKEGAEAIRRFSVEMGIPEPTLKHWVYPIKSSIKIGATDNSLKKKTKTDQLVDIIQLDHRRAHSSISSRESLYQD